MPDGSPLFERKFSLDSKILAPGSATALTLGATTDADVAAAIASDQPFPRRVNGKIPLGSLALATESGRDIVFQSGQGTVHFGFSSNLTAGAGVFDDAKAALAGLPWVETPGLELPPAGANHRFALMQLGYSAQGKIDATHPLGVVGSATFGVQGGARSWMAVVHRFQTADGAATVLARTAKSWRLPRHVEAGSLAPGTWVIADLEGSLALKIAAQAGYDFNFLHEARLGGLTGDLGLRVDAAIKATLGIDFSAKFLAVVSREGTDEKVRLQLFRQSKNGMSFAFNLKVGATTKAAFLPGKSDEFVRAVFGVQSAQILRSLQELEKWTDKNKSVGDLVAGLTNQRALTLIQEVTGTPAAQAFEKGKQKLLGALSRWRALPDSVSAGLLDLMGSLDEPALRKFTGTLELFAGGDQEKQRKKLREILAASDFLSLPEGQYLASLSESGALMLLDRLDFVREVASQTLAALDGGILRKLKTMLDDALQLDQVMEAAKQADFQKLDSFLVGRLSLFLDKELKFENLSEIKNAIHTVLSKREEIYSLVRKALNNRYSLEVAAILQKSSSRDVLIDVEFDLAEPAAAAMFRTVMRDSGYDRLFVEQTPGIAIQSAVMTHGLGRKASVEVNLPMFNYRSEHENSSLAKVRASDLVVEEEAGRLIVYDLNAKDEVRVRRQFKSRLTISLTDEAARKAGVRVASTRRGSWSYQLLHCKENLKREELEAFTRPFIEEYMPDLFGGGSDLSAFYTHFDATVEDIVHNGANQFGDVLTTMQVSVPGSALTAWLRPRDKDERKAAKMEVSRRIQSGLKRLLPHYYFQDLRRLRQNPTGAALLVWAAIRPSTSVALKDGRLVFNTDQEPYWNHPDPELRRVMATNSDTAVRLAPALASARLRLLEAGETHEASFFEPSEGRDFLALTADGGGAALFRGLVLFEAEVVDRACRAIEDLKDLTRVQEEKPSEAIERLALFGSDITTAFHQKLDSVYADKSALRALGQMVFLDASRALDPALAASRPTGMLTMTVLKETRSFDLASFLNGAEPPPEEVAVSQRLVTP